MNSELRGKTYIAYARCAAADGSAKRLREQILQIRQFADQLAIRCVDEIQLAGVSGWLPALRPDLHALLERKRKNSDYEVLVVTDHARLSRVELEGIGKIENAFLEAGVQIVYLTERMVGTAGTDRSHDSQAGNEHCG